MKNLLTLGMVPSQALFLRQEKQGIKILGTCLKVCAGDTHQTALLLAAGILAFPGTPKPVNHPQYALAMTLLKQLHETNQINRRLRKTPKGLCADYDISRPSDAARRQATEAREKEGKIYHGVRSPGIKGFRRGVQRLIVSSAQALCQ